MTLTLNFLSQRTNIYKVRSSKKSYQILVYLKLLALCFIFCLPRVEASTLPSSQVSKFQNHEASWAILVNHSTLENKAVKKTALFNDFLLPENVVHTIFSLGHASVAQENSIQLTSHFSLHLKARAPPLLS